MDGFFLLWNTGNSDCQEAEMYDTVRIAPFIPFHATLERNATVKGGEQEQQ